jgi:lipid-A-disaccharide synthase-like uncharacterized protein
MAKQRLTWAALFVGGHLTLSCALFQCDLLNVFGWEDGASSSFALIIHDYVSCLVVKKGNL